MRVRLCTCVHVHVHVLSTCVFAFVRQTGTPGIDFLFVGDEAVIVQWAPPQDDASPVVGSFYRVRVAETGAVVAPWAQAPLSRFVNVAVKAPVADGHSVVFELVVVNAVGLRTTLTRSAVKDTSPPVCLPVSLVRPADAPPFLVPDNATADRAAVTVRVALRCADEQSGIDVGSVVAMVGPTPMSGAVLTVPVAVPVAAGAPTAPRSIDLVVPLNFSGVHGNRYYFSFEVKNTRAAAALEVYTERGLRFYNLAPVVNPERFHEGPGLGLYTPAHGSGNTLPFVLDGAFVEATVGVTLAGGTLALEAADTGAILSHAAFSGAPPYKHTFVGLRLVHGAVVRGVATWTSSSGVSSTLRSPGTTVDLVPPEVAGFVGTPGGGAVQYARADDAFVTVTVVSDSGSGVALVKARVDVLLVAPAPGAPLSVDGCVAAEGVVAHPWVTLPAPTELSSSTDPAEFVLPLAVVHGSVYRVVASVTDLAGNQQERVLGCVTGDRTAPAVAFGEFDADVVPPVPAGAPKLFNVSSGPADAASLAVGLTVAGGCAGGPGPRAHVCVWAGRGWCLGACVPSRVIPCASLHAHACPSLRAGGARVCGTVCASSCLVPQRTWRR
jgi:hypothetical protein